MLFNFCKKLDFPPDYKFGRESLAVVRESKVLGMIISENLKWDSHITYICKKAYSRIWLLRRMMQLGLDHNIILDVYFKEIRSLVEYGAVIYLVDSHTNYPRRLKIFKGQSFHFYLNTLG